MSVALILPFLFSAAAAASAPIHLSPDLKAPDASSAWEFKTETAWNFSNGQLRVTLPALPVSRTLRAPDWAILRSEPLGNVTIEASVRCDAPQAMDGRGLLIFLGFQSPSRFYFVDLSNRTGPFQNGVFLVDGGKPHRIDIAGAAPMMTDRSWRKVRIVRGVEDGSIRVYAEDSVQPIMSATDRTILSGRIGFGTTNNSGAFKEISVTAGAAAEVSAPKVETPSAPAAAARIAPSPSAPPPDIAPLDDVIIHISVHVPLTPAAAFAYFSDAARIESWLAPRAEVELRTGGKYELFWDPQSREDNSTIGCRVTAFVPGELIAFQWRGPTLFKALTNAADPLTHVVVSFVPTMDGTTIHLIHSGWRRSPDWESARKWQEKAWRDALETLVKKLAAAAPPR